MKQVLNKIAENKTLFFSLISLWLCLEFVILGPYSVIPIFDYADSWIPAQQVLKDNLFSHGLTYWIQSEACGIDRLAQDFFYSYFPNLMGLVFPLWLSNAIHIFLQYFLAIYFVYRLGKEHLSLSENDSVLAGVIFALFCQFNPMLFGVYLFPMTVFLFDKIYHSKKGGLVTCIQTIALALLTVSASLVVYLPYSLPILAAWFLFIRKNNNFRFWAIYIFYCLVIVACKAPSLMSLILNASLSHRDYIIPGFKTMSREFYFAFFKRPVQWILPSTPAFILMIAGVCFSKFRDKKLNIFFLFLFLTTIGASFLNLGKLYLHINLAGYQFDRYGCISPFFYCFAIVYALEQFPKNNVNWLRFFKINNFKNLATILLVAALFSSTAAIKIKNVKDWVRNGSYTANFKSPQLQKLATLVDNQKEPTRVATAASLIFPRYAMSYGLETSDGYPNIHSMRYQKFWSKVLQPLTNNNEKINSYFNNWGNRVYLFPPTEIPAAEFKFGEYYNLNLLSLANTKYIISRSKLTDNTLVAVQNPEQEFYHLSKKEQAKIRIKENFNGNNTFFIYENREVLPRFFMTKAFKVFENDEALLNELSTADLSALKQTVLLSKENLENTNLDNYGFKKSDIQILNNSPDQITLNVTVDGKGFLFVSNSYSPYWKVEINGKDGTIIPADHTFWGVLLEKGENQVRFSYKPPYKFF